MNWIFELQLVCDTKVVVYTTARALLLRNVEELRSVDPVARSVYGTAVSHRYLNDFGAYL